MKQNLDRAVGVFLLGGLAAALLEAALYGRSGPYGQPYVLDAWHYAPQAVFYAWYGAALLSLPFLALGLAADRRGWRTIGTAGGVIHVTVLFVGLVGGHADRENQRFMGTHLTLDFLETYLKPGGVPAAIWQAIADDRGGAYVSVALFGLPLAFALAAWPLANRLRLPRPGRRAIRSALGGAFLAVFYVWPILTWNVIPGGAQRRDKVMPPVILAYREIRDRLRSPEASPTDVAGDLRRVRETWLAEQGDGRWSFADPRYPLRRTATGACQEAAGGPYNFILLQLETFRAKDMPLFNPEQKESPTPFLDGLARDPRSAYWTRFLANGMPTVYAFMALHTSLLPHSRRRVATSFTQTALDSLPEILGRHGYHRAFFTGSDPDWDNQRHWLARWYDHTMFAPEDEERDRRVFRKAAAYLKARPFGSRPFLATVISISNHYPFHSPEPRFEAESEAITARLHGSMAYTDDVIRELYDSIRDEPWFARTVIAVTGDHGYDLGERGTGGNQSDLRHESTWVPLVIHGAHPLLPRGPQVRIGSHIDLAPTILELAGLCDANSFFGHSLLREGKGSAVAVREGNFAVETTGFSAFFPEGGEAVLYAGDDASQRRDLAAEHPEIVREHLARARAASRVTDYLYETNAWAEAAR